MSSMKDIAEMAGVSRPTVSLILGGSGDRYSTDTRRRVQEAAKKLDYKPNILARSFRENRSFLVGVLTSAVNAPLAGQFGRGVQSVVADAGCAPVCFVHETLGEELTCLERCLDRKVDGLIVNVGLDESGDSVSRRYAELAASKGLPIVEVFGKQIDGVSSVGIDFYELGMSAVKHLVAAGHRRIMLFTHDQYRASEQHPGLFHNAYDRWLGYRDGMLEAGLEPLVVEYQMPQKPQDYETTFTSAFRAAPAVLRHTASPTAVICNDTQDALALKLALSKQGDARDRSLTIVTGSGIKPERSSVVKMIVPEVPIKRIGQKAAELLFAGIDGSEPVPPQQVRFSSTSFLTPDIKGGPLFPT